LSEELYGGAATEQAAGFTPMPETSPSESQDTGSDLSIRDAANELTERRDAREPDVIEYKEPDKQGRATKERADPKETVTKERAAKDLTAFRQRREKEAEQEAEQALRQHVDQLKNDPQSQARQTAQPQFSQEQKNAQAALQGAYNHDQQIVAAAKNPQFRRNVEYTQKAITDRLAEIDQAVGQAYALGQDTTHLANEFQQLQQAHQQIGFVARARHLIEKGYSPKVATAVADPEVLNFMKSAMEGYEQKYSEAVAKHAQDVEDVVNLTTQAMLAAVPELSHAQTPEAVNAVIATLRHQNPARAAAIENHFFAFNKAIANSFAVRQQVEQAKQQEFNTWAERQDFAFRSANREFFSPDVQTRVANEAMELLQYLGLSRDEIIHLHNTDRVFRSRAGQQVLFHAVQHWRSQMLSHERRQSIAGKKERPVVTTLRPGSAENRIDSDRAEKMPETLSKDRAVEAILKQRRARR
jgi:hypothetical protein